MKKKFVAAICSFALALALPTAAFADGSAEQGGDVEYFPTDNGVVIVEGDVTIDSVTDAAPAANTPAGANVLCSYEINGTVNSGEATVGLNYGEKMEGKVEDDSTYFVTVFIQHEGWNEQRVIEQEWYENTAFVNVTEFSTFTVVEGAYYGTAPKTGVETSGIALATIAAALCAGGVIYVLRKKVTA